MSSRERPYDPSSGYVERDNERAIRGMDARSTREEVTVGHGETRPANALAALMECPPGHDPEESLDEQQALGDLLVFLIEDTLDAEELWIFEALHYRKLTVRELARELSIPKSSVHRKRHEIVSKLRSVLLQYVTVTDRLHED